MHLFQEITSPAELLGKYCELMNKEIGVDSTKESEAIIKEDKNTVVIDLSDWLLLWNYLFSFIVLFSFVSSYSSY